MMKYECHITMDYDPAAIDKWKTLADKHGWHTSWIDGDPVLGENRFFYFTKYGVGYVTLSNEMYAMSKRLDPKPLRLKIEEILFDSRQ